jgi:chromosome segregation ATPase
MAENRIEYQDFIDPKLISELDKLEKKLQDLDKTLTHMREGQGQFVDPKGFSEYQKELEKLNQKIKEAEGLEKERLKIELQRVQIQTKIAAAEAGYTKELEIQRQKLNERNKEIREEIKFGAAAADSIKAMRDQNVKYRQAMDRLSISTKEGREEMARYRALIDANTEAIKANTDADRKRTMTIGEYRQEVKAAVGDMGLFGVSINGIG